MTQDEITSLFEGWAKESLSKGVSDANVQNGIGWGRYFARRIAETEGLRLIEDCEIDRD